MVGIALHSFPVLPCILERQGHTPHCLAKAFEMHTKFQETGDMRNADFSA